MGNDRPVSPDGELLLFDLVGAEVESIVFVRDYLQVTLYLPESSPRLTCYAWPAVTPQAVPLGHSATPATEMRSALSSGAASPAPPQGRRPG